MVVPRKKRERDFYSRHHRRHVPPQFEIFAKRKFTFRPISNVVAAKVVTRVLPFDIIPFVDFSEAENDFLFFFFRFVSRKIILSIGYAWLVVYLLGLLYL